MLQHLVVQDIYVFHSFVLHQVGETLALYTGHVKNVRIGDGLFRKVGMLYIFDVMLLAVQFVFIRHLQFIGCDEVEGRIEVAHGHQQGVYGTSVFQVTYQVDVQVLERTLCLVDGI